MVMNWWFDEGRLWISDEWWIDDDEDWRRGRCWMKVSKFLKAWRLKLLLQLGFQMKARRGRGRRDIRFLVSWCLIVIFLKKIIYRIPSIRIYKNGIWSDSVSGFINRIPGPEYPVLAIRVNYPVLTIGYRIFRIGYFGSGFFEHP